MKSYIDHYLKLDANVYPSEWLVRAMLGRYQNYSAPSRKGALLDKNIFKGKEVLDIGYGDGRNLVFLKSLGMKVTGIEPQEEVVKNSRKLFPWAKLYQGENCKLNVGKNKFDYVVASHSIYYLSHRSQSLKESIKEALNCLKPNGYIMFTVPLESNHTLKDAVKIEDSKNKWILKDSFYGQRGGQIIETVESKEYLLELLDELDIKELKLCEWKVNWWGTLEHSFIVIGNKI